MKIDIYSTEELKGEQRELIDRVERSRVNLVKFNTEILSNETNDFVEGYRKAYASVIYETLPIDIRKIQTFKEYVDIYKDRLNKSHFSFIISKSLFESKLNKPSNDEIRGFNTFLEDNKVVMDNIFFANKFML